MKSFKIALALISLYFCYHLVNGQYGLISWVRVRQEIQKNEQVLQDLTEKKRELTKIVSLISPGNMDPDLLDERARTMLGYAHRDENVVILD